MARIRRAEDAGNASFSKRINWKIAVYIRLSKEDGNDESLSVTNQKKIINEYLEHYFEGEYVVSDYYIDDGLTGTDYDRPDFQRMIQDMETGKINCIVCKNLSRMFRNYSDQGYFLEKIFPLNKLRFVTVSDPKVDSYLHPEAIQGLEVPINGLMNDRYAAKTSKDVRDTFATKRRKGEFIGAFAPYGYTKSPGDKNKLILDEEAAQVVRDIFHWFVFDGMSKNGIAKRLNESGIPNPTAYKQGRGLRYSNPQIHKNDGYWCSATISTVLSNRVYVGTMVQGKQMVISYKVHDRVAVSEDEWVIVEGTHEPIVDSDVFSMAQNLQKRDTRAAPGNKALHLFAGFIRCADCGKAMTRQVSKGIVYYYCRTFRDKSKCTKHVIKEAVLIETTLKVLQKQIELVDHLPDIVKEASKASCTQNNSARRHTALKSKQRELDRVINIADSLYGDWKSGEISREDYHRLRIKYEAQAEQIRQVIHAIQEECENMEREDSAGNSYVTAFLKHQNIISLERGILTELVDRILIYEGSEIKIGLTYADPFRKVIERTALNHAEQL